MKDLKLNKNTILIIIGIVVLLLVLVLLLVNPFKKENANNTNSNGINNDPINKQPTETKSIKSMSDLEKALEEIGAYYYENEYYKSVDDIKNVLPKFAASGVNITLDKLNVFYSFDKNITNALNKYSCNFNTSKIFFYPEAPYNAKNYTVKARLDCSK